MTNQPVRSLTLQQLREQLERWKQAGSAAPRRAPCDASGRDSDGLSRLLSWMELRPGMLVEWLSDGPGSGVEWLSLVAALRWLQEEASPGVMVLVDESDCFHPPPVWALGLSSEQLLLIRPETARDALWAVEQALRCRMVSLTLWWEGGRHRRSPTRGNGPNDRVLRRWQLAAEQNGGMGFLVRSSRASPAAGWTDIRLRVRPAAVTGRFSKRRLRVEVLRRRGGFGREALELDVDDETGDVRLVAELASAADPPAATGT